MESKFLTSVSKTKYVDNILESLKTDTKLDFILSEDKGFCKAVNYLVYGPPGAGKTTIMLYGASLLHFKNKRCLYVSGEMSKVQMKRYATRFHYVNEIPILYPHDINSNFYNEFIKILDLGWDIIILDSWKTIVNHIKAALQKSTDECELLLINDLKKYNDGLNKLDLNTTFIIIQQVNKDERVSGKNYVLHMVDSELEVNFEDKINKENRYIINKKHRLGENCPKLFFYFNSNGILFDETRYEKDLKLRDIARKEKQSTISEKNILQKMLESKSNKTLFLTLNEYPILEKLKNKINGLICEESENGYTITYNSIFDYEVNEIVSINKYEFSVEVSK